MPIACSRASRRSKPTPACARSAAAIPGSFQDETQALLRKKRLLYQWRGEIEKLFQQIDPVLERQLFPADAPRRLVVQLYGSGISIQTDKLWERFKGSGFRIPLTLEGGAGADGFLRAAVRRRGDGIVGAVRGRRVVESPLESWFVETRRRAVEVRRSRARR